MRELKADKTFVFGEECEAYKKSEADKVIAELESDNADLRDDKKLTDVILAERNTKIAELEAMAKEPSVPNRPCLKCGSVGTLMYMPIIKDVRTYWDLYNNKGIDYVVGIQCAHCGEVAFVTKQTHEYELRHHKFKRCLAMAKWCFTKSNYHFVLARHGEDAKKNSRKSELYAKWHKRWLELADKFKEDK